MILTAVWLKHKPSGIQIRSEEERTQHMNKTTALKKLKKQLQSRSNNANINANNKERKTQIGSGMRANKIRTIRVRDNTVKNHLNGKKMKYTDYVKGKLSRLIE